jgi:hypothetical protein
MAVQSTDSLLLAIETTADLAGIQAVKAGIGSIPPVIANMSTTSRQAFDAMDTSAKKAAMSTMGLSEAEQAAYIGTEKVTAAVTENTAAINVNIGAFVKRGEMVDRNSVEALNAYRAEGDALSALLAKMGATEAELNRIGGAITKVETAAGAATVPGGGVGSGRKNIGDEGLTKIPGSARTAANALAMLSSAAIMGQGSAQGMMVAVGGLTTGLASLSSSAQIAAAATGIGALITVAATVGFALYKMGDQATAAKHDIEALNDYSAQSIGQFVTDLKAKNDQLEKEAARTEGFFDRMLHRREMRPGESPLAALSNDIMDTFGASSPALRALERGQDLTEQATRKAAELGERERIRLITQRDQIQATIRANELELRGAEITRGSLDTFARQAQALTTNLQIERDRIKEQFRYRDEHGHEVALTSTQRKEMERMLDLAGQMYGIKREELGIDEQQVNAAYKRQAIISDAAVGLGGNDVKAQVDAKEAQIRAEGELDIAHGRNRIDVERSVQAKIVEIRRATMKAAADDAKTIVGVLLDSGSKQVKAIGHAADAVRRVQIGAQAAHAAVESAIEFGKAIGSAASLDFRGAALHASSGLALARAAALGAKESLGGGGGGSSGGGGGGGGADPNGAFRPRTGTEGQGNVVINLLTQDPYGATKIQQVMYELNRAQVLGRPPVQIPPTTGISRVA